MKVKIKTKPIKGYEGIYTINNKGEIFSCDRVISYYSNKNKQSNRKLKGQLIKLRINTKKYYDVKLYKNGIETTHQIHRLVALAFVPNLKNKFEVNHIDGNKLNNYYKNLEWCTQQENVDHAWKYKLIIGKKGELNGCSKLTNKKVIEIRKLYKPYKITGDILAKKFNVSSSLIYRIIKRNIWKHI